MGGSGGWPGPVGGGLSNDMSDISTNSRSRIFLAVVGGNRDTGLNGPLACRSGDGGTSGVDVSCLLSSPVATDASTDRAEVLLVVAALVLNVGRVTGRVLPAAVPGAVGGDGHWMIDCFREFLMVLLTCVCARV